MWDFIEPAPLDVTTHVDRTWPYRSYPERAIEDALVKWMATTYPALRVVRQWRGYRGAGIPDLVAVGGALGAVTVIEIKAVRATQTHLKQLARYVETAQRVESVPVFGVLAAPSIAQFERPSWFSFWELWVREKNG